MASETPQSIANDVTPHEEGSAADAAVPARRLDPGFRRNLLIIGGAFGVCALVIVAIFLARAGGEKPRPTAQVDLPRATGTVPTDGLISPAMRESLAAKQADEKRRAQAEGGIYIPPETLNAAVPLLPPSAPSVAAPHPQEPVAVQAPSGPSAQELEAGRRRDELRRAGMERQLGQLVAANTTAAAPARLTFAGTPSHAASAAGGRQTAGPRPGSGVQTAAASQSVPTLADGLEIFAAETASPIDTYRTSYVSARIVSGKLAGAFVTGKATQTEEGLQFQYTMMRHGGKTYAIDAIGLDEKTSTDAMEANVDRRYLQRFVMPVLTAGVIGYAQARAQTGSTVVDAVAGSGIGAVPQSSLYGVSTPAPTEKQARQAGVAAGLGLLQQEVAKAAQRPYQMTLDAGTPIGIMFRAPVAVR